jgi:mRNA interferase YafQ
LKLKYTTRFKRDFKKAAKQERDFKKAAKQEKDLDKLKVVIDLLLSGERLPAKYRDHAMTGRWHKHRDCHVEPDWILIYRQTKDTLVLERMGSHSDLFK